MKTTKVMIQMMMMAKMLLRMMMMMAKEYKTQPLVSDWIDGSALRETDLFQLSQSLYTRITVNIHCIIYCIIYTVSLYNIQFPSFSSLLLL